MTSAGARGRAVAVAVAVAEAEAAAVVAAAPGRRQQRQQRQPEAGETAAAGQLGSRAGPRASRLSLALRLFAFSSPASSSGPWLGQGSAPPGEGRSCR